MDKLQWIKDLVLAEQKMEESGEIDITAGFDPEQSLQVETIDFLRDLKTSFVEAASAFNQLKGSQLGNIKIYGISKTQADFMLFRNGFKLIFSCKSPGVIGVRFFLLGSSYFPGTENPRQPEEDVLRAEAGAYGDLQWTFNKQRIRLDYLIRYYMSRFVRESAK